MKFIVRRLVFAGCAIYLTSLWNFGFIIPHDLAGFLTAVVIVAVVLFLITPLTKIILLPLNIITLGIVSFIVNIILFYLATRIGNLIEIKEWVFYGIHFLGMTLPKMEISFLLNLVLSSLSVSVIISLLGVLI